MSDQPAGSGSPSGTSEFAAGADVPFGGKGMSRKRIIITTIVGIVVMVGVFALLLPQVGSYEQAFAELGDMEWGWVVALIVACVVNLALYPFTVLVSVDGLGYWHGFVERQTGFLISCAIPGGGVFAVGAQYRILSGYGVPPSRSAAAVAADAIWTYLLTLSLPALGVLLLVIDGRGTAGYLSIAILGLLAVGISILVIITVLRSESGARRVGRLGERLIGPIGRRLGRPDIDLTTPLVRFRDQANELATKRWGHLTITNFVAQTTPFLVLVCALGGLHAFDGDLSLAEVFAAYSIALLLVSIPITPGGLGTVDAALVALLIAFGLPGPQAVAADLLWRLVWFLPQILTGLASLVTHLVHEHRKTVRSGGIVHP
ncbi:MAG: YbhN family protein [Candidatus Nanopelagicales bacterium]|nr:YbhN family protein [Candidatus Nanopelagicales bacterium]